MAEPRTTALDPRYSDPAASPTSWEETERILVAAELFWLTTVRADGRPHVTPLVGAWADGTAYFHTGAGEQKSRNLAANRNVVLTTGCNTWDRGVAARITDEAGLARLAPLWAPKWDGRWRLTARDGGFADADGHGLSQVYAVTATKVFAHAKGDPFGATTHTF